MAQGSFWDSEIWCLLVILSLLFGSLLLANLIKKTVPFLKRSLIPSSVLGGLILLLVSTIYFCITKEPFFELKIFGTGTYFDSDNNLITRTGASMLEVLTYHFLGIGFVAMAFRDNKKPLDKESSRVA